MHRLLDFFYQQRAFLFFILLEIFCFWLVVEFNPYQGASFFNTSNRFVGQVLAVRSGVVDYFRLSSVNQQLTVENAQLRDLLVQEQQKRSLLYSDTTDFLRVNQYNFIPARVINNSVSRSNNYITLNKGLKDGISPNMGVIASDGLIGRVKSCSQNFSTVISLLHSGMKVASKIKGKNIDCTVEWDGSDARKADLLYVVRHHKIAVGDTIVTSDYNPIYPPGVMIGTISKINLNQGRSEYDIEIELSTDFTSLSYVYVVDNKMIVERDSLENSTQVKELR